jgi:Domain of unknown function (DUF6379)
VFEKYVLVDGSLRRVGTGFSVDLRIPYYRGLGLSMVNVPELTVDGEPVDLSQARFSVHGNTYPLTDLPDVDDDRWGFNEAATLTLPDRPIPPGEHELEVVVSLRISYLPVPSATRAAKTLALIQ